METHKGVGWYEIPVVDMDRAKKFYGSLFDIEMSDTMDINEISMSFLGWKQGDQFGGALVKGEWYLPSLSGVAIYFMVPAVGAALEKAAALGARVMVGSCPIGEHGHIGFFKDLEGNKIGVHSMNA